MLRIERAVIAALLLAPIPFTPARAQTPTSDAGQVADVVVNMRDVEIADVAEQISRVTGRTLILDPSVSGKVNVTSAEPLSVNGVWELFQSVLRVHGFAAVRSGRAWRIIPQANAIRDGGAAGATRAQDVVTRLIRLRNLSPEAAARVFRPLVASFGSVEPLTAPNAIVVTDYAENVRRIEQLAVLLDSGGAAQFESIALRHATAEDVAKAIRGILGDGAETGPRVVFDERSNVVLVRGDARSLAEARRVAAVLDQPGGAAPTTRVFRLSNGDAESVTEILRGLMGDQGAVTNPVARSLADSDRRPLGRSRSSLSDDGDRPSTMAQRVLGTTNIGNAETGGSDGYDDGFGESRAPSGGGGFAIGDLAIQPAPEINAIVVRGSPAQIAALDPLIAELDVRRPQVMIEAAIVEVTGDTAEQLGVQLGFGAAAPGGISAGATSFTNLGLSLRSILSVLGAPAAVGLIGDGLSVNVGSRDDFSILVQALGQSTKANLLSTPSLTTLDNEAAEIVVGQNVPFRTGSFTTQGNSTNPFTTIERQDVGITLKVIPRIHRGDAVRLEVSQEVSSLLNANVAGAADLITNRRSIQTTVLADNGQTIVLGGLITDDRMNSASKVPILGDIPGLGVLFRSRRDSQTKRTLFVFLRPTILRDRDAAAAATRDKYARLRSEEASSQRNRSLLLEPPGARLTVEIQGLY